MGYDINLHYLGNYYLDSCCFDVGLGMDFDCIGLYHMNLASEKLTCILSSVRSTSSRLTSIILIVVVIVTIIIIILVFLYLYRRSFEFLLRLFAFSFASSFGLFGSHPFKGLRNICFLFVI